MLSPLLSGEVGRDSPGGAETRMSKPPRLEVAAAIISSAERIVFLNRFFFLTIRKQAKPSPTWHPIWQVAEPMCASLRVDSAIMSRMRICLKQTLSARYRYTGSPRHGFGGLLLIGQGFDDYLSFYSSVVVFSYGRTQVM
jgi:hypothetical protein